MKKVVGVFILIGFVCSGIFAQNADSVSMSDYFPAKILISWTYANGLGKEIETIFVKDIWPDEKDGTDLYLFEEQLMRMNKYI